MMLTGGATVQAARTGALATLILTQLIHVFECKSESRTLLQIPFFNNWKLIGATGISLAVMCFAIWHPMGRSIFETTALGLEQLKLIGIVLLIPPLLWGIVCAAFWKKSNVIPVRNQENGRKRVVTEEKQSKFDFLSE